LTLWGFFCLFVGADILSGPRKRVLDEYSLIRMPRETLRKLWVSAAVASWVLAVVTFGYFTYS
jgi:hypothetical protein